MEMYLVGCCPGVPFQSLAWLIRWSCLPNAPCSGNASAHYKSLYIALWSFRTQEFAGLPLSPLLAPLLSVPSSPTLPVLGLSPDQTALPEVPVQAPVSLPDVSDLAPGLVPLPDLDGDVSGRVLPWNTHSIYGLASKMVMSA